MRLFRLNVSRWTLTVIHLSLFMLLPTLALAGENKTTPPGPARPTPPPVFKDGANCLFIGHSFFIPVAKQFDKVATRSGFRSHKAKLVFAGGKNGSPGALWDNPKRKKLIEAKLAGGKIDLLGMTVFSKFNSSFKDYQQWIDLALKYNPKTRFFIGQCWAAGGPRLANEKYDQAIAASSTRVFKIVTKLRTTYPKNHIYFINYGKVASEMKSRYAAKKLPDITKMVGRDKQALYRDGFMGHGGPMMLELSSLVWLNILYGAEITKLKHTPYQSDVNSITTKVVKYNQQYR